jgi:nucleoside-diphosphate-sugar epimerase
MMDYSHTNPLVPPEAVTDWLDATPKPIAITGGTGFIGSHLVDSLCAAGLEPRVLVRNRAAPRWIAGAPVEWIEGSLQAPESLRRLVEGVGTVLHLAGVVRAGRERDFDAGNRQGTANLVGAIGEAAAPVRLVYLSSLAAAGPSPEPAGVGPEVAPAPISWYGRSKLAAEREVREAVIECDWSIVRPPAVYGPRDTDVFEFFRMAARGFVAIPGGERWLTVAWVGDIVRAVLAGAVCNPGGIFHVGGPEPLLLERLVQSLGRAGGVTARVVKLPPALVSSAGAIGSILQRIGWRRVALTRDKSRGRGTGRREPQIPSWPWASVRARRSRKAPPRPGPGTARAAG